MTKNEGESLWHGLMQNDVEREEEGARADDLSGSDHAEVGQADDAVGVDWGEAIEGTDEMSIVSWGGGNINMSTWRKHVMFMSL